MPRVLTRQIAPVILNTRRCAHNIFFLTNYLVVVVGLSAVGVGGRRAGDMRIWG